jgi:hypothetical protein
MQLLTSPPCHLALCLSICLLDALHFHEKMFAVKLDVTFVFLGNREAKSDEFAFLRDWNNIGKTIFILVDGFFILLWIIPYIFPLAEILIPFSSRGQHIPRGKREIRYPQLLIVDPFLHVRIIE